MFRTIKNLILIVILCFTATGIPVYANFVFNYIISDDYVEYDVKLINYSGSNHEVSITFSSNHNSLPLEFELNNPLSFKLFINDKEIKDVNLDVLQKSDDPLTLSFNLTSNTLNVPDGDYTIEVKPNISNISTPITPIKIDFVLDSDIFYLPVPETIASNKTALTLYFPDNEYNRVIPITRVIPYTNMPLRATINELYKGPSIDLGLPKDSPIPNVSNLNLNRDVARVYLPRDMGAYSNYSSNARVAFSSFVSSLTSIHEVNAVQFYINWQIHSDGFHGMSIDEPIFKDISPKLYVGYKTDSNRILLYPINSSIDFSITNIFNSLKYSGNIDLYSERIYPPIPEEVELLDYNLSNGVLQLKFNEYFSNILNNGNDIKQFITDSLVYSYTSYPEVESVVFSIDEENPIKNPNIFNKPIQPSPLINIEQEY